MDDATALKTLESLVPHLSDLDTGAGNRGPVAVAPKTIIHVVESSRWKGCRYAVRQRHAGCGRVTAGGGGDRAAQGCAGATGLARDDEDRSKTRAFGCREPCRGATDRIRDKVRDRRGPRPRDRRRVSDPPTSYACRDHPMSHAIAVAYGFESHSAFP